MANAPENTPAPGLSREEIEAIARDEIKRAAGTGESPNLDAVAAKLADEKAKVASARAELAEARAKVPAEGAVVLTGDEATAYAKLKEREGFDAAPLATAQTTLDANATALQEAQQIKAQAGQDAALRAAGYDPAKVRRYLPDVAAAVRLDGEGDAAKPVLVTKGDDGAEVVKPLADAMQADHSEILSVITGDATIPAQRGGATIPSRPASGALKPANSVADYIASVNEARSSAAGSPKASA